ncbi:MAG TPA: S26 family signal peptidase [Pirellulales bacterium]|nr:S26 family signal peptidase [Pirellulales bacterium]
MHSPTARHARLRRFVGGVILTLVGLLAASAWCARPFVVAGPSMAETLLGSHRQLTCADCGCVFRCGADEPGMLGKRAVCPNCGDATLRLDTAEPLSADGVLVDRSAFLLRSPRRWELAAFRRSEQGSQVYVKRVVGLPGETIDLRHGDIYANGVIQRKTLAQQRAMAVMVYDSNHEPSGLPSRWLPDAESSWRQSGGRFWRPAANLRSDEQAMDWLTYHHRRRGSNGIVDECPITDDCGYNQTTPVTESNAVRDLVVRCWMRVAELPRVTWLMTDGVSQFLIELDFAGGTASVVQDGRRMAAAPLPRPPADDVLCELALCDHQVLLALDRREVLSLPYTPPDVPLRPTSRPIAVGSGGDGLEIWDLVLLRDVYYRSVAPRERRPSQARLGGDEYYVLGDNSSASLDSRSWTQPGIAADDLVGKPLLAYPSGMVNSGPGSQFQVPPLDRFRYIR